MIQFLTYINIGLFDDWAASIKYKRPHRKKIVRNLILFYFRVVGLYLTVSGVHLTLQPNHTISLTQAEEQSIEPFVNTLSGSYIFKKL